MRSVSRSSAPEFLSKYTRWEDLDGSERQLIRDELVKDFGTICAYCQQPCVGPTTQQRPDEESVDHFRPRLHFPTFCLDWENLVFACRRCNQVKGDNWPSFGDGWVNQVLSAGDGRYVAVTEYVSPNVRDGQRPAEQFFSFDAATGEISPSDELENVDWSMALRTIRDIDLNDYDSGLGENDESHLWNRRLGQRALVIERINQLDDFHAQVNMMLEFLLPDKPFSGFVRAYVNERFPLLRQVVQ